ncbi:5-Hydroxytryptamine Receptor 6 [Manis pentadactyla]|nr:5-Hydroxytryptamine Receptor 6 [Manis pentadactyla]
MKWWWSFSERIWEKTQSAWHMASLVSFLPLILLNKFPGTLLLSEACDSLSMV